MSKENAIDLSRRKLLLNAGSVSAAGVLAGLGTLDHHVVSPPYVRDDDENGTDPALLQLSVHYEFDAEQDGIGDETLAGPTSGTVRGDVDVATEASVGYDLPNVAPGDSGHMDFRFSVVDGPAYLRMGGELTASDGNEPTEPEREALDAPGADDDSNGSRLADAIEATLRYRDGDGGNGDEIVGGTLREVLTTLADDVPLDGDGDADVSGDERAAFDGGSDADVPTDETGVRLEWWIDESVGNGIQSDTIAFDLSFSAEQARNVEE